MLGAILPINYGTTSITPSEGVNVAQAAQGVQPTQAVGAGQTAVQGQNTPSKETRSTGNTTQGTTGATGVVGNSDLTPKQQKVVTELKQIDQQVRDHEAAHMAAGGTLVRGGVSYDYQTGPDGKRYAVGGEVQIDTTPVEDDPKATMLKAERIKSAALAPADPSSQDLAVAAAATQMQMQAQQELTQQSMQNLQDSSKKGQQSASNGETQAMSSTAHKAYETAVVKTGTNGLVLDVFSA